MVNPKHKNSFEKNGYKNFIDFLDYFKKKNILNKCFRLRYFLKDETCNSYVKHRNSKYYRPYVDIGMKPGKIRYALTYGEQKGYIKNVSNYLRKFDVEKLRESGLI